jgi:hypothetical protein
VESCNHCYHMRVWAEDDGEPCTCIAFANPFGPPRRVDHQPPIDITEGKRLGPYLYSGELPCAVCKAFRDSGRMNKACETCGTLRAFEYVPHATPDAHLLRTSMRYCVRCIHDSVIRPPKPLCPECQAKLAELVVSPCPCERCVAQLRQHMQGIRCAFCGYGESVTHRFTAYAVNENGCDECRDFEWTTEQSGRCFVRCSVCWFGSFAQILPAEPEPDRVGLLEGEIIALQPQLAARPAL